jgi:hypothetical protein
MLEDLSFSSKFKPLSTKLPANRYDLDMEIKEKITMEMDDKIKNMYERL